LDGVIARLAACALQFLRLREPRRARFRCGRGRLGFSRVPPSGDAAHVVLVLVGCRRGRDARTIRGLAGFLPPSLRPVDRITRVMPVLLKGAVLFAYGGVELREPILENRIGARQG